MRTVSADAGWSQTDDYRVHDDPAGPANLSTTVVHALADVSRKAVTEAETALADSVAPRALDRLFAGSNGGGDLVATSRFPSTDTESPCTAGEIVVTPPDHV